MGSQNRMLEIILVAIVTLFLARHPKRRRRYNLRPVRVQPSPLQLGTLGANTVIKDLIVGTTDIAYRMISITATWSLLDLPASDGPITVGYAHDDYTVAEIAECLLAGDIAQDDKIAQERGNRLVRVVGTFMPGAVEPLNDGKPIKTRLNWLVSTGNSIAFFAFNDSGSALATGAVVFVLGTAYITRGT